MATREHDAAPDTHRLHVRVPLELHERIRWVCFRDRVSVQSAVIRLLEDAFPPEESAVNGRYAPNR